MSRELSTITVLGCGYVGLTTAALLANCGYKVYAVEPNPKRLKVIKSGRSFFYEAGINPLIARAIKSGNMIPTNSYAEAIPGSDVIFSCVGTPDNPDGSSNLSYVFAAAQQSLTHMKPGAIYVQKSTVPVGTGVRIQTIFAEASRKHSYVSNPEFLREATAIRDTLWFDRVVVGSNDKAAATSVTTIYKTLEASRDQLAKIACLPAPTPAPAGEYIMTSLSSAELIKVTANAFLALKVSFANSIAKLADKTSANITEVMNAVGADRRIGKAFLQAGRGYGGGCFPKDISGLIRSAEEFGVNMHIMKAATDVNSSMPHYIITKATDRLDGTLNGRKLTVLGLAFKSGTSDVRKSPAITIANTLVSQGAHVTAYDPEAMEEARHELDEGVIVAPNLHAAVAAAECIFIATDWPQFINSSDWLSSAQSLRLVVDCMNCFDPSQLPEHIDYLGIGR